MSDKRYSSLKAFLFPDRIAALQAGTLEAPVHVRIKPTNHCNHSCWYCAYRHDDLQLGDDMNLSDAISADKMAEIVDDVISMGVQAVTFSGGGEPLIYKPLYDCIENLAAGGVRIATLTNGSNLKGRIAEAFARHGTWVRVSLDAWDDESYAESRGIKHGYFTKLLDNLRDFANSGTQCELGVSFIVGEKNCDHIYETCAALKGCGVKHVKISAAVVSNDVHESNAYHAPFRMTVAQEIERAKTLNDADFTIIDHYHALSDRFAKPYATCPSMQYLTIIGADSKVYACQDKAYTEGGLLGSLENQSFKTFWFSEENRQRVYGLNPSKSCAHHCMSHSKNVVLHELLNLDPEHAMFV